MFWFIMYVNESIKSTHVSMSVFRGRIPWCFSLSEINISPAAPDLELILFPLWYWPIMNTHTHTHTHTHTKQQDKVFETDFLLTVKNPTPICTNFGTKSYYHIAMLLKFRSLSLISTGTPSSVSFSTSRHWSSNEHCLIITLLNQQWPCRST